MSDYRSSITIYSSRMTEDELATLLGPDWVGDDTEAWEVEWGVSESVKHQTSKRRWLYWQGNHGSWFDGKVLPKLRAILELRSDVEEIRLRREDQDANYDGVISGRIITRDGEQEFNSALVPHTYMTMVAAIRGARRQGNDHAAWLSVEHLLAGLEKGYEL
jgi:hypothetical protein